MNDPDIAQQLREAREVADRWKANHKDAIATKRGTDARLKTALAALQQIYDVCRENAPESCDARMALAFVYEVAGDAFEKATTNLPRRMWDASSAFTPAQSPPPETTEPGA